MGITRQVSVGVVIILVLNATVAANEMSRLFETLLPYYCQDVDEASCRQALQDPGTLLINVLRMQAGLKNQESSGSALQQMLQVGASAVEVACNFSYTIPIIPLPVLCDWTTEYSDDINWEPASEIVAALTKEPAPDPGSGSPSAISRLQRETSTPATAGLLTPIVNTSTTDGVLYGILQFRYSLQGTEENTKLEVKYDRLDGTRLTIWSSDDNFISNTWESVSLFIYPSGPFRIAFESTLSSAKLDKHYAALDDINLQVGVLPSDFDCEEGTYPHPATCGLASLDDRWQRLSGSEASTNGRGPTTDHTLGTSSGHFIINVKPNFDFGTTARLVTQEYHRWSNGSTCTFRFYYHAKTSGDMQVTISADSGTEVLLVNLNFTETWEEHDIDLTRVLGKYQVTIQVSTAGFLSGDHIAIDDVQLVEDECQGKMFCSSYPCLNNGACWQTSETDYGCECVEGTEGPYCGTNVDECSDDPSPCSSAANRICKDALPGYQCVCKPGTIEYNGKCIQACTETSCTRKYEVCQQNDNAFSCQCQYGYVESEGKCVRDKSEVESGVVPYTFNVLLGTYLGGSLVALAVAGLVVLCYFSCCDDRDDDWKPDLVEANHHDDADVAGGSGLNANGTATSGSRAAPGPTNGDVEMRSRGPEKM